MINNKKVLGIIPARGGSKGLPRKNILSMAGRPLICWTIDAAKASAYIDRLILTSDDDQIMAVARENGVEIPFKRPAELATDAAAGSQVVLHALDQCPGFDLLVLLQPTSPLRIAADIDQAVERTVKSSAPCCVSICPSGKSPFWSVRLDEKERLVPIVSEENGQSANRQELPATFDLNGAVYVARTDWFKKTQSFRTPETIGYIMPKNRSVDIDDMTDFKFAELLIKESAKEGEGSSIS